jgi:two-component system phosphate regulon sensor histidine kinase PhoR
MDTNKEQIERLKEENELWVDYFKNTIIPQLFIDDNLVLRKFTPSAMKQFDLKPDDVGKPIQTIINKIRYPSIIENIKSVIHGNSILEKEVQTTDAEWYQMNILPVKRHADNKTDGVIVTFVDVTLRIKDLKEQEQLISDHETLLDNISHDIKTPLTSLMVSLELIENVSPGNLDEIKHILKLMGKGIGKINDIITELTDARKQEHKYKAEEELLNLENILEDVRLTLADMIAESGAVIKSKFGVSEITFSRRRVRSIVYNLINYAIKFKSPDKKPEIFFTTSREENFILISIKDNGMGIDPDEQNAVFTKYYREQDTIAGSGVGLYLVKEMIEKAGGRIVLESEPGTGSEFKIYLKTK